MGSVCGGGGGGIIDEELERKIKNAVDKSVKAVPDMYKTEKEHVLDEMRKADPNAYEGLLYADYPAKNEKKVNELVCKNIASNKVKEKISDEVYKQLEPTISEKTADMSEFARNMADKAVQKLIEKTVDKAVDEAVDRIMKDDDDSTNKRTGS